MDIIKGGDMQFHPTILNRKKLDIEANLDSFLRDSRCILKDRIPQTDKILNSSISPLTTKQRFNAKHPEINQAYFTDFTRTLLLSFYPKICKCGSTEFKAISTRETEIRCVKCKAHISLTSYTPSHHLKTPLWTLGYLIKEAIDLHPQPLTSACISKKLKVGNSTATTLKRRIQLFLSDMIPSIKLLMAQDVRKDFPEGFSLPEKSEDITGLVDGKNVVFSDSLAIFSASQRANGYRSRYKHRGQTSSIFLSDEVALEKKKYQIGILCHTLAIKGGPVIFTSVPDQTQKTIEPLLDFLPENHVHFSDEGFPWLARLNDNFRAVNHSARAKNLKRNVWAKNRWSKNGVHSQTAEGNQRALKTCMRNYSYVSPEYSQMYLNEFSALKAIKIYGLVKLAEVKKFGESSAEIKVLP